MQPPSPESVPVKLAATLMGSPGVGLQPAHLWARVSKGCGVTLPGRVFCRRTGNPAHDRD